MSDGHGSVQCASSPGPHARHRLGSRPRSSEMEMMLVSTASVLWLPKITPQPPEQRQEDGMQVGSSREGKGKKWGDSHACHRGLT